MKRTVQSLNTIPIGLQIQDCDLEMYNPEYPNTVILI